MGTDALVVRDVPSALREVRKRRASWFLIKPSLLFCHPHWSQVKQQLII
jgi:hypothetical protein